MVKESRGQGIVVVGGQWGDEGKGRIVDSLAATCDVIARFQGGNNAGHSLHIGNKSFVLHLIPCGIVREDKVCVIGNGVVLDPLVLAQEIDLLRKSGVKVSEKNLRISKHAHIIFPYHRSLDAKREGNCKNQIGTTKKGIGPCYESKVARFGVRASDLLCRKIIVKKLANFCSSVDNLEQLTQDALSWGEMLQPYLCDTGEFLQGSLNSGKRVLFEGAQGTLLDVDHGTYPYVTSSNCIAAQASIGTGIGANMFDEVLMVAKAYSTRVGGGPFFTELPIGEQGAFREAGGEFGATTGRPRRCGWLDLPALKYAARVNGATGLILTKIDILSQIVGSIKICYSYSDECGRNLTFSEAMDLSDRGGKISPNYMDIGEVPIIPDSVSHITELPVAARELCSFIEEETQVPIKVISYGKKRGQELFIKTRDYE